MCGCGRCGKTLCVIWISGEVFPENPQITWNGQQEGQWKRRNGTQEAAAGAGRGRGYGTAVRPQPPCAPRACSVAAPVLMESFERARAARRQKARRRQNRAFFVAASRRAPARFARAVGCLRRVRGPCRVAPRAPSALARRSPASREAPDRVGACMLQMCPAPRPAACRFALFVPATVATTCAMCSLSVCS